MLYLISNVQPISSMFELGMPSFVCFFEALHKFW